MRYTLKCLTCGEHVTIRGTAEYDVNAVSLDENDSNWSDACEHIAAGGDYDIIDSEPEDDGPYESWCW